MSRGAEIAGWRARRPGLLGVLLVLPLVAFISVAVPRLGDVQKTAATIAFVAALLGLLVWLVRRLDPYLVTLAVIVLLPIRTPTLPPGRFGVTLTDALVVAGLVVLLCQRVAQRAEFRAHLGRADTVLLVWLVAGVMVSSIAATAPDVAFVEAGRLAHLLLFSPLAAATITSRRRLAGALACLAAAMLVATVATLLQVKGINVAGLQPDQYNVNVGALAVKQNAFQGPAGGLFERQPGLFFDPLTNAQFLSTGAALLLPFLLIGHLGRRAALFVLLAACSAAIWVTLSRNALVGWAMAVVLFLVLGPGAPRLRPWRRVALLACLLVGAWVAEEHTSLSSLSYRLARDQLVAGWDSRLAWWSGSLAVFRDHAILGIGLENYRLVIPAYDASEVWHISPLSYVVADSPESGFLKLLYELGLVGGIPLFLFFGRYAAALVRRVYRGGDEVSRLAMAGALLAILVTAVNMLTVYNFSDDRLVRLLALAVVLGQVRFADRECQATVAPSPARGGLVAAEVPLAAQPAPMARW